MEGFINGNRFRTMIDTGFPDTIIALGEEKENNEKRQVATPGDDKRRALCVFQGKATTIIGIRVHRTSTSE